MTPTQDLFNCLFKLSKGYGLKTYDYLPDENEKVTYPFVIISDSSNNPWTTKTSTHGEVVQDIEIWGLPKDRKKVDEITEFFMKLARQVIRTNEHRFNGAIWHDDFKSVIDQSVPNQKFIHNSLTLRFQIM